MLPSKISPTSSPFRLMTGEPELPPMMSLVDTKSSGVERSSLSRPSAKRGGQVEGFLVVERRGPIVQAVEGRLRRRNGAVHRIALDGAVGQPQREGGVGIRRFAVDRKARLADLFAGPLRDALDVVFLPAD